MTNLEQENTIIKPDQIVDIIIRYKWLIILPLCISLSVGILYTVFAKRIYEASTTILVQPQKVPLEYVQSIVSTDLDRRLNTVSQQILSRSNLEKIIDQFGLFEGNPGMYLEDKIQNIRGRVKVEIDYNQKRSNDSTDVFYVSFRGENPERVQRIANTLASYFMDENLKVREAQVVGTSEFLDSELQKIKKVLEEKERILSEYRSKHFGGLPDELDSNLRTLDRLQLQLSDKLNSLMQLESSLSIINSQVLRTKQAQEGSVIEDFKTSRSQTEQLYEIEKIKLEELQSKYTKNHPDIVRLTKSVEKLKEKIETENEKNEQAYSNQVQKTKIVTDVDNFLFEQQLRSKKIISDIKKHEADVIQIQQSMALYQKRVGDTPKREQELQSLNRDYNNISDNYNSLLSRKLESDIAVNMEKKQKGEQFRILDHARIPQRPISPDVQKLFLLSLVLGLGLGGGLIFLLEFTDNSIKSAEQVGLEFGLPILASISSLKRPGKNYKKQIEMVLFSLFSLYAMAVLFLFILLNYKGVEETIRLIKVQLTA